MKINQPYQLGSAQILVVAILICFSACKKEAEAPNPKELILGKWQSSTISVEAWINTLPLGDTSGTWSALTYNFSADGNLEIEADTTVNSNLVNIGNNSFFYTTDGVNLTFTNKTNNVYSVNHTILNISENQLQYSLIQKDTLDLDVVLTEKFIFTLVK